jgi:arachidonate 15-lipoxygenase
MEGVTNNITGATYVQRTTLEEDIKRCTPHRTCLPQQDPLARPRIWEIEEQYRAHTLSNFKKHKKLFGIPPTCEHVPPIDKAFYETAHHNKPAQDINAIVSDIARKFLGAEGERILRYGAKENFKSYDEFVKCFFTADGPNKPGFPPPQNIDIHKWTDDVEFARQRLEGPHSSALQVVLKIELLPKKLLVTDEQVIGLIEEATVEEAITAQKVYIIDYHKLLEDTPCGPNRHVCAPIALFYIHSDGTMRPIAIQLYGGHVIGDINPVFTPNDNYYAWSMAKMYFNNADFHVHMLSSLWVRCLSVVSIISIVTNRNFSCNHPLRQLLRTHLDGVIADNHNLRTTFFAPNGVLSRVLSCGFDGGLEIVRKSWKLYDFNNSSFAHNANERVDAKSAMKSYPYVTDGRLLWSAYWDYCQSVIDRYYTKPDDIDDDRELTMWIRDMSSQIERVRELQTSRKEVPIVFNMTSVLFLGTAHYNSLITDMYQFYANVWSAPGTLVRPPVFTKTKDQITEKDLIDALPDKRTCLEQIAMVYYMTRRHTAEFNSECNNIIHSLVTTPIFVDKSAGNFPLQFATRLKEISEILEKRNETLEHPYNGMNPANTVTRAG